MPPRELPKLRSATVYEKSAGKVRANGRLIPDLDSKTSRAEANADFKAQRVKRAVKTSRKGNSWIAGDVYDFERVPTRRNVVVEETDDSGEEDEEDNDEGSVAELRERLIAGKKEKPEPKSSPARLRRFNLQDLSFLSNASTSKYVAEDGENSHCNLDPSSDLLKSIHYHASQFYAASGQLMNSGRIYRLSRKERSKQYESPESLESEEGQEEEEEENENEMSQEEDDEQAASEGGNSSSHGDGSYLPDKDEGRSDDDGDNDNNNASDADEAEDTSDPFPMGRRRRRMQRMNEMHIRQFHEKKDMYKAFDGSTLFCIGMLLKAHIISQLQARVPEGWDDEVAAYQEYEENLSTSGSDGDGESLEESGAETDRKDESAGQSEDENNSDRLPSETPGPRGKKRKRRKNDDLRINFVSADYS